MKKKTQSIMTKILACILVVILALGIIVPVIASAQEAIIPQKPESETSQNTESNSSEANGSLLIEPDLDRPTKLVSSGFEWKKVNDVWVIQKVAGNTDLGVIVDGLPTAGFDGTYITFFIGNLETHDVIAVETMNDYSFTKSVSLASGYYVLYANRYSFSDSKNNTYAVEGGEKVYFHIGEGFDPNKYPIKFIDANVDMLHLDLKESPADYTNIKHTQRVTVTSKDLEFPEDAAIGQVENNENQNNQNNNQNNAQNDKDKEENKNNEKEETPTEKRSIWRTLKNSLSRSALIIVGIIACFIATTVIKSKKKASLEEQSETDKSDDGHIL